MSADREPAATLHDIAQGISVKAALRYSSVTLEEIAEVLADDWRIRGAYLADLAERHRMMCNGMNVAQAGYEAEIRALKELIRDLRFRCRYVDRKEAEAVKARIAAALSGLGSEPQP